VEILKKEEMIEVEMYKVDKVEFAENAFEGLIKFKGTVKKITKIETFAVGSIRLSTNQKLGDLLVMLMEPNSDESFFRWGYFNGIFSRTEYIESYIMEPEARKMLENDPELKLEFEKMKEENLNFANDPNRILNWFYNKSNYVDSKYLIYPVGRIMK